MSAVTMDELMMHWGMRRTRLFTAHKSNSHDLGFGAEENAPSEHRREEIMVVLSEKTEPPIGLLGEVLMPVGRIELPAVHPRWWRDRATEKTKGLGLSISPRRSPSRRPRRRRKDDVWDRERGNRSLLPLSHVSTTEVFPIGSRPSC